MAIEIFKNLFFIFFFFTSSRLVRID